MDYTEYGSAFDQAASRWRMLENEHDRIHPNRGDCGGVGGCTMMRAAHDIEVEMMDALEEWRIR